jgi:hypothetical protein
MAYLIILSGFRGEGAESNKSPKSPKWLGNDVLVAIAKKPSESNGRDQSKKA